MTNTTRRTESPASRLGLHHARIHELLDELRLVADDKDPESCNWGDVGDLATLAARLAELVPCNACKGTGYARGRCPALRERNDQAAQAACETCGGSGHANA